MSKLSWAMNRTWGKITTWLIQTKRDYISGGTVMCPKRGTPQRDQCAVLMPRGERDYENLLSLLSITYDHFRCPLFSNFEPKILDIITAQPGPPEPMKKLLFIPNGYKHWVARKWTNRLWYAVMILCILLLGILIMYTK